MLLKEPPPSRKNMALSMERAVREEGKKNNKRGGEKGE